MTQILSKLPSQLAQNLAKCVKEKPHMGVYLADIEGLLGVRGDNRTHLGHREQRLLDGALSLWQRR